MARTLELTANAETIKTTLARLFQSGNLNFLIGSGASIPSIPSAGNVEKEIADLLAVGQEIEARSKMYTFLLSIQLPMNMLINETPDANNEQCLGNYEQLLQNIEALLIQRRTNLLPRQATIFTTNYDLFIEKAALKRPVLRLNDGFARVPSLTGRMEFSARGFFNSVYNTGNLYSYKFETPSVNLLKLHGSLSWRRDPNTILFGVEPNDPLADPSVDADVLAFIEKYAVILPQAAKFRATLLERHYYDLLRIFANELDRENSVLISFGFSFKDEHLLDLTRRGLRNPTLRLVVFAFDNVAKAEFEGVFSESSNVDIISAAAGSTIGFAEFNAAIKASIPSRAALTV
jgi:hypothetical protein